MEKTKKQKKNYILILVLLAISLVITVSGLTINTNTSFKVFYDVVNIVAILLGFVYTLGSFKKDVAKYYKGFMLVYALRELIAIIYDVLASNANQNLSPISCILEAAICAYLFVLAFAKDLGKTTSKGLAFAILGLSLVNAARLVIRYPVLGVIPNAANLLIFAIVIYVFVIEKYADKEERGTK